MFARKLSGLAGLVLALAVAVGFGAGAANAAEAPQDSHAATVSTVNYEWN